MNKKFKVALISNTSTFFNSFTLKHIEALSKKYKLFVCCNDPYNLKKIIPENVSLINLNFKRNISFFDDVISFFLTLFFFIKERPNLSISFTPKVGLIVAFASFITKTPIRIHWFTGQIWANKKGVLRKFLKTIDKIIFLISHNVLIDSISQRKFLIKEKVISKKKSIVFHKGSVGGVNINKFKFNKKKRNFLRKKYLISQNTFVFLYLGRINKDKGIKDLLKAFEKISCGHDTILIMVGSSEDDKLLNEIKYQKKILYFDYTSKPEYWFSLADILCLPSYREGFGNVIIEAAACGIPSLCSNIYGLQDAIDKKKTGFFHKAGNSNDIQRKMLYILKNKKLTKRYGLFAKKRVLKDFEQSILTRNLLQFINSYTV
ncbi:glycosyltransferase [Candidatus Pelagibacter sp. HIMB1587]|uniref:glycosyltransferase n=1 Tax=Candidatus Pelagibacter sp. HIMB1587 TaxID=3413354 RepID=UPI003F83514F